MDFRHEHVADLADRADVRRVAERAAACDVLVANAGLGADPPLADLDEDGIDQVLDVNLRAPMVLATTFAQARIADGRPGHIVLVGSLAGIVASPGTRLYNATKFGLRGFALSLRQDAPGRAYAHEGGVSSVRVGTRAQNRPTAAQLQEHNRGR